MSGLVTVGTVSREIMVLFCYVVFEDLLIKWSCDQDHFAKFNGLMDFAMGDIMI